MFTVKKKKALNTYAAINLAIMAIIAAVSSTYAIAGTKNKAPPKGVLSHFKPALSIINAPETPFTDRYGQKLTLKNYRGKTILVNFWATWCVPCIEEMPSLERLQNKFRGSRVKVLAISVDHRGWAKINPFIKRMNLTNVSIFHDVGSKLMLKLKVKGLPTTILFDHKGIEVGRLTGAAKWDADEVIALIQRYLPKQTIER